MWIDPLCILRMNIKENILKRSFCWNSLKGFKHLFSIYLNWLYFYGFNIFEQNSFFFFFLKDSMTFQYLENKQLECILGQVEGGYWLMSTIKYIKSHFNHWINTYPKIISAHSKYEKNNEFKDYIQLKLQVVQVFAGDNRW